MQLAAWDSRATRLAWLGLQADGFIDAAAAARAAPRRRTRRPGAGHLGVDHRGVGTGLPAAGRRTGLSRRLRTRTLNTPHAVTAFVQQALGCRARRHGVHRLFVQRQGAGGGRALAAPGSGGCRGGGPAWTCCAQPAVRLSGAGPAGQRSPAAPSTPRARASASARPPPLHCCNAARDALQLAGHGEANDAHHMSSPHPQGAGRRAGAGRCAGARRHQRRGGGLPQPARHGQRRQRRQVEAALVARRYAPTVHACATKGLTGHTMGAAGIAGSADLPAGAAARAAARQRAPRPPPTRLWGRLSPSSWQASIRAAAGAVAASHSFGFGGNNCVLVLGMLTNRGALHVQGAGQLDAHAGRLAHAGAGAAQRINAAADAAPQRPSAHAAGANERRRAPDSVLMALQVAQQACGAGHDPAALASVFTSAHGDLADRRRAVPHAGRQPAGCCRRRAFTTRCTTPPRATGRSPATATAASTALAAGRTALPPAAGSRLTQCAADERPCCWWPATPRPWAAAVGQPQPRPAGAGAGAGARSPGRRAALDWHAGPGRCAGPAAQHQRRKPAAVANASWPTRLPLFEALADSASRHALPLSALGPGAGAEPAG
jgi:3-oxoacyl-[acyl-carrier-protein] synthase-1